jgi:hypothetical protein
MPAEKRYLFTLERRKAVERRSAPEPSRAESNEADLYRRMDEVHAAVESDRRRMDRRLTDR